MADPLTLLRDFTVASKPIEENSNAELVFGKYACARNAQTAFKRGGSGDYYTLDAVYQLLTNVHLKHSVYVLQCKKAKVLAVGLADRKELLAYMRGEIETSSKIDSSAIAATARLVTDDERIGKDANNSITSAAVVATNDIGGDLQATKRRRVSTDVKNKLSKGNDILSIIIAHERQGVTRNTILQSGGKSFHNVLSLLNDVQRKNQARDKGDKTSASNGRSNVGYDRYAVAADDFWKDRPEGNVIQEFGIDTTGTMRGRDLANMAAGLVSDDKPRSRSNSRDAKKKGLASKSAASKSAASKSAAANSIDNDNSVPDGVPIILVPPMATAMITMFNIKEFLEDKRFIPTHIKKSSGTRKMNIVEISRRLSDGRTLAFEVMDNTSKFTPSTWKRVVAVFAAGPNWQFKGWPWGTHAEIFSQVLGLYVHFHDAKVDPNVQQWNVKVFKLHKNDDSRHLDTAIVLSMWQLIESFIARNKPALLQLAV